MSFTLALINTVKYALFNRSSRVILSNIQLKYLSNDLTLAAEAEKKKKRKTVPIPKITLLSGDDITVTTLEEAQKISKRRDLKLVKIVDLDTKTERPIYKLMTAAELHLEDLKQREEKKKQRQSEDFFKGEKILFINSGISDHDLSVHSNKILKWITKKYEVRVVISGKTDDMNQAEKVFKDLQDKIGDNGRVLQKRTKNGEIKFQIIRPKSDSANVSA